jgi:hypothetical protein
MENPSATARISLARLRGETHTKGTRLPGLGDAEPTSAQVAEARAAADMGADTGMGADDADVAGSESLPEIRR